MVDMRTCFMKVPPQEVVNNNNNNNNNNSTLNSVVTSTGNLDMLAIQFAFTAHLYICIFAYESGSSNICNLSDIFPNDVASSGKESSISTSRG